MSVESDPQDFGGFGKGKELVVEEDLRMLFGFSVVGGEKGNRGFVRGNGEV